MDFENLRWMELALNPAHYQAFLLPVLNINATICTCYIFCMQYVSNVPGLDSSIYNYMTNWNKKHP
jgi:hypothetical protein